MSGADVARLIFGVSKGFFNQICSKMTWGPGGSFNPCQVHKCLCHGLAGGGWPRVLAFLGSPNEKWNFVGNRNMPMPENTQPPT